ncbi:MAG: CsbD family protein [Alphaproteobacteria bacterium]|nr:CsbD family protein [Alphaproteobacteria bacterium]
MNEDTIEGNWKHLMQDAQKQWSKLTNDNLAQINGSREKLAQALQKNYSIASEEAEKQMKEWEKSRSNTVKSATNS